jgi:cytochrome c oxidase cbb3-type subunit 3
MKKLIATIQKTALVSILLKGSILFGQTEAAATAVATSPAPSRAIYDMLGITSTTLFTVMTLFTLILVFIMVAMGGVAKTVLLKSYEDKAKKKSSNAGKAVMIAFLLFSTSSFAAESAPASASLIAFSNNIFWAYIVVDLVLIGFIIYFARIINRTIAEEITLPKRVLRWNRIKKSLTDAVEIENEASIAIDHDYDGIIELDNNLPPWWKYGFYITIVWAVVYLFYFQILEVGNLQEAEYLAEMEEGEREVAAYKAAHPNLINASNVTVLEDPASIAKGMNVYNTYCMSCHMESGRGGIGPNLTDDYWIYENDISTIFTTISEGASNGMPAWKELMPANDIQAVASYVLSLDEIPAPEGKEPQGELKE